MGRPCGELAPVAVVGGDRRRKTAGHRREEVAALAGVIATWYAWIEQGREIHVSAETLARIGLALRLSRWERDYVARLATQPAEPNGEPSSAAVDAALEAFVSTVTTSLVMVMDARLDVIAFNEAADRVYRFDAVRGPFARNHVWRGLKDPARRRLYPEFERPDARRLPGVPHNRDRHPRQRGVRARAARGAGAGHQRARHGIGPRVAESMRAVARHVTAVLMEETGPFVPDERPQVLVGLVERFLRGDPLPARWTPEPSAAPEGSAAR